MKYHKNLLFYATAIFIVHALLLTSREVNAQTKSKISTWKEAQRQEGDWFASDEALRIADNLLLYQHKNGGWPKNIDMARELNKAEQEKLKKDQSSSTTRNITIDNKATRSQMRYLAKVYQHTGQERFKEGFLLGIDYLLEAQYDNGGWPQYYPLRKGYYENITFNDGAMIGVMKLLQEVAAGDPPYDFVNASTTDRITTALDKGLDNILKTQIETNGELTAWCAQYDPESLQPTSARAYELISISGAESVGIVRYLMSLDEPSSKVIAAVKSAVNWFEKVKLEDIRLIKKEDDSKPRNYDLIVGFDPTGARPMWARFYEIGTNYPIFVDRTGIVQYALSEIAYERRVGYSWLGSWANHLINEEYSEWLEVNGN